MGRKDSNTVFQERVSALIPKRIPKEEMGHHDPMAPIMADLAKQVGAEAIELNQQLQDDPTAAVPENITSHIMEQLGQDRRGAEE